MKRKSETGTFKQQIDSLLLAGEDITFIKIKLVIINFLELQQIDWIEIMTQNWNMTYSFFIALRTIKVLLSRSRIKYW